jgi:hypothetical protein
MFSPSERWQWFANVLWYKGDSRITDVTLDPSSLVQQPLGLDYTLQAENMAQFSSIEVERVRAGLGFNFRLSEDFIWNTVGEYGDFNDLDPYLYDTSGSKFTAYTGVILLW